MRRLCQVCGVPVGRDELGWPWLLEAHPEVPGWPEREVTTHPPTCERCQPVAAVQCTPNRGHFASVRVRQVLTDGVYGQLYRPDTRLIPAGKRIVYAGDSQLRWMLVPSMLTSRPREVWATADAAAERVVRRDATAQV